MQKATTNTSNTDGNNQQSGRHFPHLKSSIITKYGYERLSTFTPEDITDGKIQLKNILPLPQMLKGARNISTCRSVNTKHSPSKTMYMKVQNTRQKQQQVDLTSQPSDWVLADWQKTWHIKSPQTHLTLTQGIISV